VCAIFLVHCAGSRTNPVPWEAAENCYRHRAGYKCWSYGSQAETVPYSGTGLATVKCVRPGSPPTCTCGAIYLVVNDNKVGLGDVPGRGMGVRAVASEGTTVSLADEGQANFCPLDNWGPC
jgi:hypothetical protein